MEGSGGCVTTSSTQIKDLRIFDLKRWLSSCSALSTIDHRPSTATTYLFPGGLPSAHLTAAMLSRRLNRLGITRLDRQGALGPLVAAVLSAIVARATGYSLEASARRSAQGGLERGPYVALKTGDRR